MSREKPKKIKVSVGSRIFDTVNLIFLILLGLTTFYPFCPSPSGSSFVKASMTSFISSSVCG